MVVLQSAGNDLAGGSGAAVDQNRDRQPGGDVAGTRIVTLGILAAPAAGRHDFALIEECISDGDRLIEQPAGIVAQIENHPEELAAGLLLQVLLREGTRIEVPALAIEPTDTTGAGDTFVGVLAAALDLGATLETALRQASAAAGLACLARGAQTAMPDSLAITAAIDRLSG